ncbi:hypothetical protein BKA70DRAFT_1249354 [Coprinopsis sp. MPI-PUGE-AT-0042]|nr:hypothetical protein BKA70DRAFT_1249354 [Coprinopsis sp. MPI-PUGE-AT-0042]
MLVCCWCVWYVCVRCVLVWQKGPNARIPPAVDLLSRRRAHKVIMHHIAAIMKYLYCYFRGCQPCLLQTTIYTGAACWMHVLGQPSAGGPGVGPTNNSTREIPNVITERP